MQQLCLEGWVHGASSLSNFKKSLPLLITVSDTGHINDSAEVFLLVDLLKCNATGSRTNDEAGWLWWGMTLHCVKANLKAGSTHNKPLCCIAQIRSLSTTSNVQQHQPLHGTCCDCALTHSHTGHEHTVAVLRTVHDWEKKHHVCLESLKTHNSNSNHLLIYTCEVGKDSYNHRIAGRGRDLWRSPSPRQGHLKQVTQDSAIVFASTVKRQISTFQCQSTAEAAEANWSIWTILSLRLFESFDT